ncbi:hypothetical protein GCM10009657_16520 [Oryzihumus leptocrescens]
MEAVDTGLAQTFGLGDEGGLTGITVLPGKPLGCEPSHRRRRTNEGPSTLLGDNKPFGAELVHGLTDGHAGDAVVLEELLLGGHTGPGLKPSIRDRLTQLARNLLERRSIGPTINLPELDHHSSIHLVL